VRAVVSICKRELLSLWYTPLAWVLLTTFLLLQGGIFYSITLHHSMAAETLDISILEAYFGQQSALLMISLLLVCPALTMKTFAEERRSGTIEGLLSAPVSPWSMAVGKLAAVLLTYVLIWVPTLLYVVLLRDTTPVHLPTVAVSYLGVLLIGTSFLAVGVLMSALAKNQLTALLLTVLFQFGIFLVGIFHYVLEPGLLLDISSHLSITTLLEETSRGLLDSRRIVLHTSLTIWALFVTTRVISSWRDA
jgi:ABC-2 type transport system permease protein